VNPPQIRLYAATKLVYTGDLTTTTELGRQADEDVGPLYSVQTRNGVQRIAITNKLFTDMSRQLLLLTPIDAKSVRVANVGKQPILLGTKEVLKPKQQREFQLPTELTVFDRRIVLMPSRQVETVLLSMNDPIAPPGEPREPSGAEISQGFPLAEKLTTSERDQFAKWLSAVTRVLQSALSAADFQERAAQEMVELIGLDSGRVLEIHPDGEWKEVSRYVRTTAPDARRWMPVSDLLRRIMEDKKTSWTTPLDLAAETSSRVGLMAAVAAPLLNRKGEVTGALYGDRRKRGAVTGDLIGPLEAMLVETLARGVAAGRARLEEERKAAELHVRFEQFFTAEMARQLIANPDLMTRRDTEVSILFCDIRRFSAISEERGAEVTMEWLSDVMGRMADCAAQYEGALIDYIGDELMVMWGAPGDQPDHATRACRAALKMASQCAEIDLKWKDRLGTSTQFGIGVNTGRARVGNVGFERKFRYAPFGNTVNLASRVQGATKYIGAALVVTESTYRMLHTKPPSRRLCSVRVVNIEQPVVLYQLFPEDGTDYRELCQQYQVALASYEKEDLATAIRILSEILRNHPDDGPTLMLLSRAVEALLHREGEFNPVFDLPGK
jgi:adenylate cyclase